MDPSQKDDFIRSVSRQFAESYQSNTIGQHIDATFLPSRARTVEIIEHARKLMFPGFFDDQRLKTETIDPHLDRLLQPFFDLTLDQIEQNLRYELNNAAGKGIGDDCDDCHDDAVERTMRFFDRLPDIREKLLLDVAATFDGDPAADSMDEAIFCYPGIDAILVHRLAHEIYKLELPLLARIMSEVAHTYTGIDIHPGATIGDRFFIDHGTGIVIGETCVIGDRVKLYQGVTLGALSTRGGQAWRGRKRHPSVEDDVTIYGGAIILGGATVIGAGATIGGSVFITESVPPNHTVTMQRGELLVTPSPRRKRTG
ncbi:serine O-acetyltransferase EpsC [Mucisphaera calidilacus]|uniref:Serine acetyltransferase n=1 Tax=Mucisphaera calidilacus TaxID=2527982 RepID=A0A518BVG5_9BACT|nr:serine O-acetyltransferase EpsC [Mucisphaera calidilacus]QDU70968.1 Serine acetyltransferase [Mucisphaera calidilacus]